MKKKILITGATKGIGNSIAKELSKVHNVYITGRNIELLTKTAQEINAHGFIQCNLADKADLTKLGEFIAQNKINILINNAGEYLYSATEDMEINVINRITETNLQAPIFLAAKSIPEMKAQKWGRIINIGSISGVMGEAYACVYSASKSGLIGFTKALALELAEFNITVNTINPGWVETELGLKSIEESEFSLSETLDTIPQKRFVQPKEIEKLIEYLISEDAKGLTGQSINLCAGLSVGI